MKTKKITKIKSLLVFTALTLFGFMTGFAQSINPSTALNQVNTQVRGMFGAASNLLFGIAALIAIVGVIHVYTKWSKNDPNTTTVAASWFGALVFVALSGVIIRALTGVN